MLYDSVRFFIFVLSLRDSAMSGIFVLDLGGGSLVTNTSCGSRGGAQRGPAPSPLFLHQNEARRAEKKFESAPPPPMSPSIVDLEKLVPSRMFFQAYHSDPRV